MGKALLVVLALLWASPSVAANHFIRPDGEASVSGTGGCSSGGTGTWEVANACPFFPATLVRGDTYCVADGDYSAKGQRTFSTAVSGTTVITIKKATDAAHCDQETGWVSTLGDGQATFLPITFSTGYWTWNGVSRNESNWKDYTAYGFRVDNSAYTNTLCAMCATGTATTSGNLSISYTDIEGSGDYADNTRLDDAFRAIASVGVDLGTLTVSRSALRDTGADIFTLREWDDVIVEYNYIARNGLVTQGASPKHTQACDCSTSINGLTWRYNWTEDISGTAIIATSGNSGTAKFAAGGGASSDWRIHGNRFTRSGDSRGVGDCVARIVGLFTSEHTGYFDVVGNTIVNQNVAPATNCFAGLEAITLLVSTGEVALKSSSVASPTVVTCSAGCGLSNGQYVGISGHVGSTPDINGWHLVSGVTGSSDTTFTIEQNVTVGGTGGTINTMDVDSADILVQNNLTCDSNAFVATNSLSIAQSYTWSHNAYCNVDGSMTDTDANMQIIADDPFTNSASDDYTLTDATTAGATLASPYDVDAAAATRGADGVWDRGAYEHNGAVDPPASPDFGGSGRSRMRR